MASLSMARNLVVENDGFEKRALGRQVNEGIDRKARGRNRDTYIDNADAE